MSKAKKIHAAHAAKAKELYLRDINSEEGATDWHTALRESRKMVAIAIRKSEGLKSIGKALAVNGGHMLVFRHLVAPPVSQDQFQLRCPVWPKSSEKSGRGLNPGQAAAVAACFNTWRDKRRTRWLDGNRKPRLSELRDLLLAVSPLIASQQISTTRRNRHATRQEQAAIQLLESKGWKRMPSLLIDRRASIPAKHFMHKTRFATASAAPQEVDIACGLKNTLVLAIECKVSNDATNSIKRINDVIKKAEAWRTHWGNFVVTAAILQGVIAEKDIYRLLDHNIQVFWSHDLSAFEKWIDAKL